jgi:hypothetical protein
MGIRAGMIQTARTTAGIAAFAALSAGNAFASVFDRRPVTAPAGTLDTLQSARYLS